MPRCTTPPTPWKAVTGETSEALPDVSFSFILSLPKVAHHRAFVIIFIFLAVGRAGEVATSNWDKTVWCPITNCLRLQWSSTKTSKEKGLGILSERQHTFMDFYLLLSNLFIFGFFSRPSAENDDHFWFPSLRPGGGGVNPQGVAPLISRWLADLTPDSKNKSYVIKVESLPADVSSGSLRHSAINIMAAMGVMVESIVAMSGHFLTSVSAVFEYLNITVTSTVIGMMVLTGWNIPTHTMWVKSPPTPTLKALIGSGTISEDDLVVLMNHLYHLHYDSHAIFRPGGSHRKLAECMFATTLMHFAEVHDKYPGHEVSRKLLNAVVFVKLKETHSAAEALIKGWGERIKSDWLMEALPEPNPHENMIVSHLAQLKEVIEAQRQGLLSMFFLHLFLFCPPYEFLHHPPFCTRLQVGAVAVRDACSRCPEESGRPAPAGGRKSDIHARGVVHFAR